MATFSITDQTGATYQVDAPDENAAMSALGQVAPHVAAAQTAAAPDPATSAAAAPPQAPSWIKRALTSIVAPVAGSLLGANPQANPGLPTIEGTANDIVRNTADGATLGWADKLAAGGDALLGSGDYATNLAAQRAQSQAAMDRQGVAGNIEQIGGMMAPAGALGEGVAALGGAIGGAAKALPLVGRVLGNPFVQAAATGAGVGAGDAAGNDTNLLRGALTGAAAGIVGKGAADAATIPVGWLAGKFNAAPAIPTAGDNAGQKTAAYAAADRAGVIVTPAAAQRLSQAIQSKMADLSYHPVNEPGGQAVLDALGRFPSLPAPTAQPSAFGYAGASGAGVGMSAPQPPMPQGVTLQGLDTVRQLAGRMGQANASSANMGGQIKGLIDDFLNNLGPADILSGDAPAAIAALNNARRLAQIGFKSDAVGLPATDTDPATGALGAAMDRTAVTGSGGNINNAIRQQARALKNSGQPWTPDESAAIQSIIDGTPTQNALRIIGKFSPTGSGLMAGLESVGTIGMLDHAGLLGAASGLAVPAIGYAAKTAADNASVRGMTALGNLVRSGGDASALAPAQNAVQQATQAANAPLSTAAMDAMLRLLGPAATDSVARSDANSRARGLAETLIQAKKGAAPSGLGAVFAQ